MKKVVIILAVLIAGVGAFLIFKPKAKNAETTSATKVATNDTSETAVSVDKVSITNFAFSPPKITIKKGTTVTWTNQDSASHTVTSDSGSELSSETMAKGQTYTHLFSVAGKFAYHCAFHSSMTGTVEVTE